MATARRRDTIPASERPACAAWVTDYALHGGIADAVVLGLMGESGKPRSAASPAGAPR